MQCPNCNSERTRVKDTMNAPDGKIYRRRKCSDCGQVFRSVEVGDDGTDEFRKKYLEAIESKSSLLERRNKNGRN